MFCQAVIDDARVELNDPSAVQWTDAAMLGYLNDGLLALALYRPDAFAVTEVLTLSPGTRQELPNAGIRLMKITRNMGADGTTPGQPIQLGDMAAVDALQPSWHTDNGTGTVYEYFYDPLLPTEYYVYPRVASSPVVTVLASYVKSPDTIEEPESAPFPVDKTFVPAIREWIVYRALSPDDETSPNYTIARDRRKAFFDLLGVKVQGDATVSAKPKVAQT